MRIFLLLLLVVSTYATKPGYIRNTWTQDNSKYIATDEIRARDSGGLKLYDDSGTVSLFVKDGGNVGIGTASPGELLTISSTVSSYTTGILLEDKGTQGYGRFISWKDSWTTDGGSTRARIKGGILSANNGRIDFETEVSGVMTNTLTIAGGNVGIGTEDPLASLSVNSGASVTGGVDIKANGGIEAAFYDVVSDQDLKTSFEQIPEALTMLLKIEPVSYLWKNDPKQFTEDQKIKYKKAYGKTTKSIEKTRVVTFIKPAMEETENYEFIPSEIGTKIETYSELIEIEPTYSELSEVHQNKRVLGLKAQNICENIPQACREFEGIHKYNLESLFPVLIKAIQEQQTEIEALKIRVTALEKQ